MYIWIEHGWNNCNRVYGPVDQYYVSGDSTKEEPEDLGIDWSIGYFFDSVGSDETYETGSEGVTDAGTK